MKKYIALLMCAMIAVAAFTACSNSTDKDKESTSSGEKTTELATDKAKVTGSTAMNLLKSYSKEELGLKDVKEDYQFMLGTTGTEIDGEDYVRAVAGAMVENGTDEDGNTTYNMQSYGTYYISYDGKTLLIQQDDGSYKTLKIDQSKITTTTVTADEAHSDAEKTTKK